jgi:AcrR family transcriptional regulator
MTPDELKKRTRKAPEERRQELLAAGLAVFTRKGVAATTIEDITVEAGLAKGTFYLHFSSKEEVVAALRDRFVDDALAHATELLGRVGVDDWWALVDTTIEAVIDWHLDRSADVALLFTQGMTEDTRDVLEACEAKLVDMFAFGIRAGEDAGAFQTLDAEATARMLFHAIDGTLMHAIMSGAHDRDRMVASAKELAHKVLAPSS